MILDNCKSWNFCENFTFANSIKRHICDAKKSWLGMINILSKQHSDFGILWGFYFHETSHMRSFAKIKPSQKFPIYCSIIIPWADPFYKIINILFISCHYFLQRMKKWTQRKQRLLFLLVKDDRNASIGPNVTEKIRVIKNFIYIQVTLMKTKQLQVSYTPCMDPEMR